MRKHPEIFEERICIEKESHNGQEKLHTMQVETALSKTAIIAAVYTATATHPKTIHRNPCQAAWASEPAVSSVYKPITIISNISDMGMVRNEHTDKLCCIWCTWRLLHFTVKLHKCPQLQVPQVPPDTLLPAPSTSSSTYAVPSTNPNSYMCRNTSQMRKMCHHIKNLLP